MKEGLEIFYEKLNFHPERGAPYALHLSLSRPKMQRQGVGTALLEESVKVARRQGFKAIQVTLLMMK